ncbi:MAG TPA: hypothetical protein VFV13_06210 [Acidimicrobiia bacterium]|nr:hypothetical protein [Acidimicrobiia bacterium]
MSTEPGTPRKGYGMALGNALAEFEAMLSPAAEHRVEEQRRVEIAPDEVGIELDETSGKVRVVPPQEKTDRA